MTDDIGGVAGGTKYLVSGILFKFATDHHGYSLPLSLALSPPPLSLYIYIYKHTQPQAMLLFCKAVCMRAGVTTALLKKFSLQAHCKQCTHATNV